MKSLSLYNANGVPTNALQMEEVKQGIPSLSELSTIEHLHTGVALLLQLLSDKFHARKRTPRYFARDGEKGPNKTPSTTIYTFTCTHSSAGANIVMMPFGGGAWLVNCLIFSCGSILPCSVSLSLVTGHTQHAFDAQLNSRDRLRECRLLELPLISIFTDHHLYLRPGQLCCTS